MSGVLDWLVAYLFRWLPRAAPTGLFPIGHPDEHSPVIVTANFSLTVTRVRRALRGEHLWLLVVNSEGINVWCAADGGIFTHHRVIDAIKVSGLGDTVTHRDLVLPALSAPGVDLAAIREHTGFHARFGPVYARDIPAYLAGRKKKTEAMRRVSFGLAHRLDMFLAMNFPVYLAVAVVLAIVWPQYVLGFTALFWGAVAFLYLLLDWIPGGTGWTQTVVSAGVVVLAWACVDWLRLGEPLVHRGWLLAALWTFLAAGFDIAGTVSPRKSDPERILQQLGFKNLGSLYSDRELGHIALERDRCNGCRACFDICPVGVYGDLGEDRRIVFRDQAACFACSACVKQCPEQALALC